ncbi:MAG: HU family DNA-binding protein [Pseudomonadota bacterium]
MTKAELVALLAEKTEASKASVEKVLSSLVEVIVGEVKAGRDITLTGLGSFALTERAPRKGRNPRTGEEVDIEARKAIKFKPSKTVKDALN